MTKLIKNASLAAAALVAIAAVASPASAQSFSAGWGTGNVLPFSHKAPAPQQGHAVRHSSGFSAYAMSPRWTAPVDNSTGGGSVGYNQLLMTH
ncbi:MAG TPA: hypothetical protein VFB29_12120 [Pseudolabrys sp.]|nr:hypothetical protein [Pseudolabrys sp.]